MSITKAEILAFTNSRLNRADTDIDESVKLVLRDIANQRVLKSEDTTQTLTSSSYYLTYPTDALDGEDAIISVVLTDSSSNIGEPLVTIAAGWKEYKLRMEDFTSSARSEPCDMITHDRKIYPWPAPNGTYTSSIWYYKRHDETADTIEFSEDWRNALYFGVTMEVAIHHKMVDQIKLWTARYEREKEYQRMIHTGD